MRDENLDGDLDMEGDDSDALDLVFADVEGDDSDALDLEFADV